MGWSDTSPFPLLSPLAPFTSYPCVSSHSPEYIRFLSQLPAPLVFACSLAGLPIRSNPYLQPTPTSGLPSSWRVIQGIKTSGGMYNGLYNSDNLQTCLSFSHLIFFFVTLIVPQPLTLTLTFTPFIFTIIFATTLSFYLIKQSDGTVVFKASIKIKTRPQG